MSKANVLYLIAYLPIFILYILFAYLRYHWKIKRYKNIFAKTLKNEGVPRKIAKSLAKEINVLTLKDILKNGNMRNIL